MTKSYSQVIKQIESLKAEAEKLRRKEVGEVIDRIRQAITHYGLTAADLGLRAAAPAAPKAPAKKAKAKAKAAKPAAAVKYRDEAGRSWGGIGKRPQWLRDALAAGKSLDDFKVQ